MKKFAAFSSLLYFAPLIALAQTLQPFRTFLVSLSGIIAMLVPLLIAAALVAFFWGLIMYIFQAGNEEARKKGRQVMLAGVVALFIMVTIWGIIALLQSAFGVSGSVIPTIPAVPRL